MRIKIISGDDVRILEYTKPELLSRILRENRIWLSQPCGGRGVCGKCTVFLDGRAVSACTTRVSHDCTVLIPCPEEKILTDGILRRVPEKPWCAGYGVAVDVGTTTIAAALYRLNGFERVASGAAPNPQGAFGADVISRIQASIAGHGNELRELVTDTINHIIDSFGVEIDCAVICGNTTMLHLLCGLDVESLSHAPFLPDELFGDFYELALHAKKTYITRCVSAFIGGDVVSAVSAVRPARGTLIADIGTNGELVYAGSELYATSVAAGPAFEGVGIACGGRAVRGAISRVWYDDRIRLETVADAPAESICGSGLIDAVAMMRKNRIIDETGYLEKDFFLCENVYITQGDIRALQLAKGAIAAGIEVLAQERPSEIVLCGAFGSLLNVSSAADIGLIPRDVPTRAAGNAALSGAALMLKSSDELCESLALAKKIRVVSLASNPIFSEKYAENMLF